MVWTILPRDISLKEYDFSKNMTKRNIERELEILENLLQDAEVTLKVRNALLKQLEVVKKCTKPKRSNKGKNQNQNSGLLKPVGISEEMAQFANWDPSEKHSRVDVTKVICAYVKENNLQKKSNKKTIIPDDKLKTILRWLPENEQMIVTVKKISDVVSVVLSKEPVVGLKKIEYYNNSELKSPSGPLVIKSFVKNDVLGGYDLVFVDEHVKHDLKEDNCYVVAVPLTYPKIQTKISLHLEKPPPAPKKPAAPKKQSPPPKQEEDVDVDEDSVPETPAPIVKKKKQTKKTKKAE
jgi:chromatin remodeling complex protein RSC6